MFRLRRIAGIALEDFGLRRRADVDAELETPPEPEPEVAPVVATPVATSPTACPSLVDGCRIVVWSGSVRRSEPLQRFVEHLDALRAS
jgi:hypothetical protein